MFERSKVTHASLKLRRACPFFAKAMQGLPFFATATQDMSCEALAKQEGVCMHKILITSALLLVFGTSAYMSIYGLAAVFAGAGMVAVLMGAGMELGKLLTVIHLHRQWSGLRFFMRSFYMIVIAALVMITSFEILGYLSQSHIQGTRDLTLGRTALIALEHEEQLLAGSIATIDITLAGLPAGFVTKRIRERQAAGYDQMQARLVEIAKERSDLEKQCITNRAYAAPIFAAAGIFGIDATRAASIFILVLVMVLEPLSIGLAVAASSAWACKNEHRTSNVQHRMMNETHASPLATQGMEAAGRVAETAKKTAKAAEAATKTAKAAHKPAEAAHPLTVELGAIQKRHNLKIADMIRITGRKQPETVSGWLDGNPVIPIKAMRLIRRWARHQPSIRIVETGQTKGR